jgi:hypothetical protein
VLGEQDDLVRKLDLLYEYSSELANKYNLKIEYLEELKFGVLRRAFEIELVESE